jgi:DNA-binding MarR family transcriptional regulator
MIDLCGLRKLQVDLAKVEERMKKEVGLTFVESSSLCSIQTGRDEPAAIAESMELSPSRTSRIIVALEKKGMIMRCPSIEDRRVVKIGLTPKGKEVLETIHNCDTCLPHYIEEAIDKAVDKAKGMINEK